MRRLLLGAGIAMPVIYFGNLIVAEAMSPAVNAWMRLPSDLGVAPLQWAPVFNAGLIAVGASAIFGAGGLFLGLRRLGAKLALSGATGLAMTVSGLVMAMAGLFPLPNPLHYGFNLLPLGMLTPLLGALALGASRDAGPDRLIVGAGFLLTVAIVVASETVDGLVTHANAGIWARGLAFVAFSTIACLCWAVLKRVR